MRRDLGRYRRGEPMLARPDSATYRLGKFVARRRLAVGAATATTIAPGRRPRRRVVGQGSRASRRARCAGGAARATAVQDFPARPLPRANSVAQPDQPRRARRRRGSCWTWGAAPSANSLEGRPRARRLRARHTRRHVSPARDVPGSRAAASPPGRSGDRSIRTGQRAPWPTRAHSLRRRHRQSSRAQTAAAAGARAGPSESSTRLPTMAPRRAERLLMMLAQAGSYTAVDRMNTRTGRCSSSVNASHTPRATVGRARLRRRRPHTQRAMRNAETMYAQALASAARGRLRVESIPLVGLARAQEALGKIDRRAKLPHRLEIAQSHFGQFHPETLLTPGQARRLPRVDPDAARAMIADEGGLTRASARRRAATPRPT